MSYYAERYPCSNFVHVQIVGDSSTVISWLNCQSVGIGVLAKQIIDLGNMLYDNWKSLKFGATAPCENIAFCVPREHNKQADALATTGVLH